MVAGSLISANDNRLRSQLERGLRSVNARPRLWLTLFVVLLLAQVRPWWIPQPDSRSYLSMARSLAEQGRMLNLGREHLWYFPGYSLLMSPLYLVSEHPYWLISGFQWVAAALLMLGVYHWARSVVPQWAVWIALLSGVNAGVWFHAARALSEVPFMCALVWAANAGIAACRSRSLGRMLLLTAAASALLAITALIRPAGMMLAAGFGLSLGWQALRGRVGWPRAVTITLALGLPAAGCVIGFMRMEQATASQESARTYLTNFGDSARSPLASYLEGVRLAVRDSGRVVIPGMFKAYQDTGWLDPNLLIYVPLSFVLAWSWWRLTRQTADPLLLGVPFYVLLHVVYPYEAGARFFVPLLPLFAASLAALVKSEDRRRVFAVAAFCGAHMLIAVIYWLAVDGPRALAEARRGEEIAAICRQMASETPRVGAVNLSENELLMLELQLDRSVTPRKPGALPPADEWLVSGRRSQPGGSYRLSATTTSFALSRRESDSQHRAPLAQ
ncbi:MAG TPA: hypothetical protein VGP63_10550 [Planctomycetaceae bacterium]|jgi:hypothetical protein|nr:hypothetical protein [Planctomycetaceae bacterium]